MPKAILSFNLPEETEEHKHALEGSAYYGIIWDIAEYVRSLRKYDERETLPKDEVMEKLLSLIEEAL